MDGPAATAQHMAFKEWATICAALDQGRQIVILRKGGIHEGRQGFRVEHREFWLFPTYVHQEAMGLTEEARPLLEQVQAERPADDTIRIRDYAVIQEVVELHDESLIPALAGHQLWSQHTLAERFHYRQNGLFLLVARIYRAPETFTLLSSPHLAGCRSWVDLPAALPTARLQPVLSDEDFHAQWRTLQAALSPPRLA